MKIDAEKYPLAHSITEFLRTQERKQNVPVDLIYVSFDARDEILELAKDERIFLNTARGELGEVGVSWLNTILIPTNQVSGDTILTRVRRV